MTFSSEAQLKQFLVGKCIRAVANTERKVHGELDGNLNQFYTEFSPAEYIRTGALYSSLETTGTMSTGNGARAEIRFNTPAYKTGRIPLQSGRTGLATWSGAQVLDVALTGGAPHGGYAGGTAIWNESMATLGDIGALLMQELKRQGL